LDAHDAVRDGAWVAGLTDLLDLSASLTGNTGGLAMMIRLLQQVRPTSNGPCH